MSLQPEDPKEIIRRCTMDLAFQFVQIAEAKMGVPLSFRQIEEVDKLAKSLCWAEWDRTHNEIISHGKEVRIL